MSCLHEDTFASKEERKVQSKESKEKAEISGKDFCGESRILSENTKIKFSNGLICKMLLSALFLFFAMPPFASAQCKKNETHVEGPLASALHLSSPLGKNPSKIEKSNFDGSLTDFLVVTTCLVESDQTCTPRAIFTANSSSKKRRLYQEKKQSQYLFKWNVDKADVHEPFTIHFDVANLEIGYVLYTPNKRKFKIKFGIDNHPRIRVRVLNEQGFSAMQIADVLLAEFNSTAQETATLLHDDGFNYEEICSVLKDFFQLTPLEAAEILLYNEFSGVEITICLRDIYELPIEEVSTILRTIDFFDIEQLATILQESGYLETEIHRGILPLLIEMYAPIVYFHSEEQYLPSSAEWYVENARVRNKKNNQVQNLDLSEINELTQLLLACEEAPTDDCPTEKLDYYLDPLDETRKQGNIETSTAYVHLTHANGIPDTFDIQFWLFYPYNGPGTLYTRFGEIWSEMSTVEPVGEHTGDWEGIILRFDATSFQPHSVFLSAHGLYPETVLQPSHFEGNHPKIYASLNGHAHYLTHGNNPEVIRHQLNLLVGAVDIKLYNRTNDQGERLETHANYEIVAYDGEVLPHYKWIEFPGKWGPSISMSLPHGKLVELMWDHMWPAVLTGCGAVSVLFTFFSIPICAAALTTTAELARDDIIEILYTDGLQSNGPSGPGDKGTVWYYNEYPDE